MILSMHQAEHAENIEQKCRWTHAAWSESFHVSSSSVSLHISQLFLLKCME